MGKTAADQHIGITVAFDTLVLHEHAPFRISKGMLQGDRIIPFWKIGPDTVISYIGDQHEARGQSALGRNHNTGRYRRIRTVERIVAENKISPCKDRYGGNEVF